ncbi:MAG: class I SAM-dependent methyltransferase [Deltaproteobacteria bacterium]|nr:class I SAM-dependent methyltransferase [Deltaproteobacteria bacterium]
MAKSYEELVGSVGRAMFFRPERTRVRDLVSREARPVIVSDRGEFPVYDLSMNGLSFLAGGANGSLGFEPGGELDLALELYGRRVYQGRARIARVESGARRTRVCVGLVTGFIDLPEIGRQDAEEQLRRELARGSDPFAEEIPRDYLEAVCRAARFVQFHRHSLGRHETRYKSQGAGARRAIEDLTHRAAEALRAPWTELRLAACAAASRSLTNPDAWSAAKEYTEAILTPLLLDCPCVRRSYDKPLGYPGDYRVMIHCYNDAFEGDSVFARVFHKLWIEHPSPAGVRTRTRFAVELIDADLGRSAALTDPAATFRVTSLGCGPAREVPWLIQRRGAWAGRLLWTLIDQDDEALSFAYNESQPVLAASGSQGSIQCLNVSFTQLLQDAGLVPVTEEQDVILATGLFDYLGDAAARDLVRGLYDRLRPGGLLVVGNAVGPNQDYWSPEFVLDWSMIYRTADQLRAMAAKLPPEAEAEVRLEPGQAYYMLIVRRH